MSRTLQSALESGQEARIVQIDFSAAYDRVNHLGILYKLNWLTLYQECAGQRFGPLLLILYTIELFSILENKLIGYADDSTLMAVVPSTRRQSCGSRVPAVAKVTPLP